MYLNIHESAIFIADSHYNSNRQELKPILLDIKSQKIKTTQLFLMGDIFDFLSDDISYFQNQNKEIIDLINLLSNNIEIVYLEGNHDFNLASTFPQATIIPREYQPIICTFQNTKVSLAHGDIFMPKAYNIYTNFIRSRATGKLANILDINNIIFKKLDSWLLQKSICGNIDNFDTFAHKRIDLYKKHSVDIIIEGHFHQDKRFNNYINLPSLACNKRYFTAKEMV